MALERLYIIPGIIVGSQFRFSLQFGHHLVNTATTLTAQSFFYLILSIFEIQSIKDFPFNNVSIVECG